MSKWNDRKKKDDEQNAQIEKPEESAVKDYSAGAIGKAYANTEHPAMKTAQTPSFDEPSLTGVYGLQKNSKGEYKDIVHPINNEARAEMLKAIMEAYKTELAKEEA